MNCLLAALNHETPSLMTAHHHTANPLTPLYTVDIVVFYERGGKVRASPWDEAPLCEQFAAVAPLRYLVAFMANLMLEMPSELINNTNCCQRGGVQHLCTFLQMELK